MLYSWNVYFHNSWLRMDTLVETQNMLEKKILAEAELFPDATTIHGLSTIAAGEELWPILPIMTNSVIVWCTSLTKGNQAMTNCNKWLEALKCCGTLMKHPFSALEPIIWIFVQGPLNIGVKIARWSKTALYAQEPLSEQFRALFDQIFPCTIFLGER